MPVCSLVWADVGPISIKSDRAIKTDLNFMVNKLNGIV
jgi:hypothetical protein